MTIDGVSRTNRDRQRMSVLECFANSADGLTCDEIEVLTGLPHQSASARVVELHKRWSVVNTGYKRNTRLNCKASVYKLTAAGFWLNVSHGDRKPPSQLMGA